MDTKLIFRYFLEHVEARNRMYIIISCQEKNPEQKILMHDENGFSKFGKTIFRYQKMFENVSWKKSLENQNLEISDFFRKQRNFEILIFY